jgi:hypothetical protein
MADEDKPKGVGVSVTLGTEIDKAVGNALQGLLQKPFDAIGTIIGDGLGIIADKVSQKRQKNLQLGMEETRKQLESKTVDLKDITPPDEEDLQVVLNGMSLAKDDEVRRLWAGLLATALNPVGAQAIDRPTTSVIEALTPQDARIISLLVFAELEDRICTNKTSGLIIAIQRNIKIKMNSETPEQKLQRENARKEITKIQSHHTQRIVSLAKLYGIHHLSDRNTKDNDWHLNLYRLGIIEPTESSTASPFGGIRFRGQDRETAELASILSERIDDLAKKIRTADDTFYLLVDGSWHIRIGTKLTPFGRKFAKACGLFDQPPEYWMPDNAAL